MSQPKGKVPSHITRKIFHHPQENIPLIIVLKEINDPRKPSCNFRHSLVTIIFVSLIGALCGARNWEEIAQCAEGMADWLGSYVDLSGGIPSAKTLKRVFCLIPTDTLACLLQNIRTSIAASEGTIVAIDGKTLRGSRGYSKGDRVLHLLHAWSVEHGICLGQVAVDTKSNEITALPVLIELLELRGTVVTADALHTHKKTAALISSKGADYVLPVKENQKDLLEEIRLVFMEADRVDFRGIESAQISNVEKSGGRVEARYYALIDADDLPCQHEWTHCKTIGRVIRERTKEGKTSREECYYVTSLGLDVEKFSKAARGHWGVENGLHWALDVIFDEDHHRFQSKLGAANLSLLRKVALAILSEDKTLKCGRSAKQMRAAASSAYREHLLKKCF